MHLYNLKPVKKKRMTLLNYLQKCFNIIEINKYLYYNIIYIRFEIIYVLYIYL